jgi:hypothetical protein
MIASFKSTFADELGQRKTNVDVVELFRKANFRSIAKIAVGVDIGGSKVWTKLQSYLGLVVVEAVNRVFKGMFYLGAECSINKFLTLVNYNLFSGFTDSNIKSEIQTNGQVYQTESQGNR